MAGIAIPKSKAALGNGLVRSSLNKGGNACRQNDLMQEMASLFTKCDVMAVPANGGLPSKIEPPEIAKSIIKPGSKSEPYRKGSTALGNVTGLPAIVIPCGFSSGQTAFPITIQFYGKPFDEFTLFRVSHAYESATDWHKQRPRI